MAPLRLFLTVFPFHPARFFAVREPSATILAIPVIRSRCEGVTLCRKCGDVAGQKAAARVIAAVGLLEKGLAMSSPNAVLHLLCGKIASGKSTLARKLAEAPATVLISEDDWLASLFADQLKTGKDYLRCSAKLQTVMGPHVASLLRAGVSVVLDFPANTVDQRAWMRDLVAQEGIVHQMHLLDLPDERLLERLRQRNVSGEHPFKVSEEMFQRFAAAFVPPSPDEGFDVVAH